MGTGATEREELDGYLDGVFGLARGHAFLLAPHGVRFADGRELTPLPLPILNTLDRLLRTLRIAGFAVEDKVAPRQLGLVLDRLFELEPGWQGRLETIHLAGVVGVQVSVEDEELGPGDEEGFTLEEVLGLGPEEASLPAPTTVRIVVVHPGGGGRRELPPTPQPESGLEEPLEEPLRAPRPPRRAGRARPGSPR